MKLASAFAALALLGADVAVAQTTYQAAVLADGPIAYYRFEEVSGTTAADTSGNGNAGTYTNSPTLGQSSAPQLGRAVRFDGVDDFVQTPRTVGGNFTLELWVNTTATCPTGGQAYEGNGLIWSDLGGLGNDFVLACLNNHASFFTGNPDTSIESTSVLNTGQWHHVVATRTQGGATQVFINGVLQATGTTNANLLDANPIIAIGGNTLDNRYFNGLIDEVAYYPTVLTPTRILAHFQAGVRAEPPQIVPATSRWSLTALVCALLLLGLAGLARLRTGA